MSSTSICPGCGAPGRCACKVSRLSLVGSAEPSRPEDPYFTRLVRELKPGILETPAQRPSREPSSNLATLIERDELAEADRIVDGLLASLRSGRPAARRARFAITLLGVALLGVVLGLILF